MGKTKMNLTCVLKYQSNKVEKSCNDNFTDELQEYKYLLYNGQKQYVLLSVFNVLKD